MSVEMEKIAKGERETDRPSTFVEQWRKLENSEVSSLELISKCII
jgi:hypothetical protein